MAFEKLVDTLAGSAMLKWAAAKTEGQQEEARIALAAAKILPSLVANIASAPTGDEDHMPNPMTGYNR